MKHKTVHVFGLEVSLLAQSLHEYDTVTVFCNSAYQEQCMCSWNYAAGVRCRSKQCCAVPILCGKMSIVMISGAIIKLGEVG